MKKWFLALMAMFCLCTIAVVPTGCTSNEATEITEGEDEIPEEGHEEAAKNIGSEEPGEGEDG